MYVGFGIKCILVLGSILSLIISTTLASTGTIEYQQVKFSQKTTDYSPTSSPLEHIQADFIFWLKFPIKKQLANSGSILEVLLTQSDTFFQLPSKFPSECHLFIENSTAASVQLTVLNTSGYPNGFTLELNIFMAQYVNQGDVDLRLTCEVKACPITELPLHYNYKMNVGIQHTVTATGNPPNPSDFSDIEVDTTVGASSDESNSILYITNPAIDPNSQFRPSTFPPRTNTIIPSVGASRFNPTTFILALPGFHKHKEYIQPISASLFKDRPVNTPRPLFDIIRLELFNVTFPHFLNGETLRSCFITTMPGAEDITFNAKLINTLPSTGELSKKYPSLTFEFTISSTTPGENFGNIDELQINCPGSTISFSSKVTFTYAFLSYWIISLRPAEPIVVYSTIIPFMTNEDRYPTEEDLLNYSTSLFTKGIYKEHLPTGVLKDSIATNTMTSDEMFQGKYFGVQFTAPTYSTIASNTRLSFPATRYIRFTEQAASLHLKAFENVAPGDNPPPIRIEIGKARRYHTLNALHNIFLNPSKSSDGNYIYNPILEPCTTLNLVIYYKQPSDDEYRMEFEMIFNAPLQFENFPIAQLEPEYTQEDAFIGRANFYSLTILFIIDPSKRLEYLPPRTVWTPIGNSILSNISTTDMMTRDVVEDILPTRPSTDVIPKTHAIARSTLYWKLPFASIPSPIPQPLVAKIVNTPTEGEIREAYYSLTWEIPKVYTLYRSSEININCDGLSNIQLANFAKLKLADSAGHVESEQYSNFLIHKYGPDNLFSLPVSTTLYNKIVFPEISTPVSSETSNINVTIENMLLKTYYMYGISTSCSIFISRADDSTYKLLTSNEYSQEIHLPKVINDGSVLAEASVDINYINTQTPLIIRIKPAANIRLFVDYEILFHDLGLEGHSSIRCFAVHGEHYEIQPQKSGQELSDEYDIAIGDPAPSNDIFIPLRITSILPTSVRLSFDSLFSTPGLHPFGLAIVCNGFQTRNILLDGTDEVPLRVYDPPSNTPAIFVKLKQLELVMNPDDILPIKFFQHTLLHTYRSLPNDKYKATGNEHHKQASFYSATTSSDTYIYPPLPYQSRLISNEIIQTESSIPLNLEIIFNNLLVDKITSSSGFKISISLFDYHIIHQMTQSALHVVVDFFEPGYSGDFLTLESTSGSNPILHRYVSVNTILSAPLEHQYTSCNYIIIDVSDLLPSNVVILKSSSMRITLHNLIPMKPFSKQTQTQTQPVEYISSGGIASEPNKCLGNNIPLEDYQLNIHISSPSVTSNGSPPFKLETDMILPTTMSRVTPVEKIITQNEVKSFLSVAHYQPATTPDSLGTITTLRYTFENQFGDLFQNIPSVSSSTLDTIASLGIRLPIPYKMSALDTFAFQDREVMDTHSIVTDLTAVYEKSHQFTTATLPNQIPPIFSCEIVGFKNYQNISTLISPSIPLDIIYAHQKQKKRSVDPSVDPNNGEITGDESVVVFLRLDFQEIVLQYPQYEKYIGMRPQYICTLHGVYVTDMYNDEQTVYNPPNQPNQSNQSNLTSLDSSITYPLYEIISSPTIIMKKDDIVTLLFNSSLPIQKYLSYGSQSGFRPNVSAIPTALFELIPLTPLLINECVSFSLKISKLPIFMDHNNQLEIPIPKSFIVDDSLIDKSETHSITINTSAEGFVDTMHSSFVISSNTIFTIEEDGTTMLRVKFNSLPTESVMHILPFSRTSSGVEYTLDYLLPCFKFRAPTSTIQILDSLGIKYYNPISLASIPISISTLEEDRKGRAMDMGMDTDTDTNAGMTADSLTSPSLSNDVSNASYINQNFRTKNGFVLRPSKPITFPSFSIFSIVEADFITYTNDNPHKEVTDPVPLNPLPVETIEYSHQPSEIEITATARGANSDSTDITVTYSIRNFGIQLEFDAGYRYVGENGDEYNSQITPKTIVSNTLCRITGVIAELNTTRPLSIQTKTTLSILANNRLSAKLDAQNLEQLDMNHLSNMKLMINCKGINLPTFIDTLNQKRRTVHLSIFGQLTTKSSPLNILPNNQHFNTVYPYQKISSIAVEHDIFSGIPGYQDTEIWFTPSIVNVPATLNYLLKPYGLSASSHRISWTLPNGTRTFKEEATMDGNDDPNTSYLSPTCSVYITPYLTTHTIAIPAQEVIIDLLPSSTAISRNIEIIFVGAVNYQDSLQIRCENLITPTKNFIDSTNTYKYINDDSVVVYGYYHVKTELTSQSQSQVNLEEEHLYRNSAKYHILESTGTNEILLRSILVNPTEGASAVYFSSLSRTLFTTSTDVKISFSLPSILKYLDPSLLSCKISRYLGETMTVKDEDSMNKSPLFDTHSILTDFATIDDENDSSSLDDADAASQGLRHRINVKVDGAIAQQIGNSLYGYVIRCSGGSPGAIEVLPESNYYIQIYQKSIQDGDNQLYSSTGSTSSASLISSRASLLANDIQVQHTSTHSADIGELEVNISTLIVDIHKNDVLEIAFPSSYQYLFQSFVDESHETNESSNESSNPINSNMCKLYVIKYTLNPEDSIKELVPETWYLIEVSVTSLLKSTVSADTASNLSTSTNRPHVFNIRFTPFSPITTIVSKLDSLVVQCENVQNPVQARNSETRSGILKDDMKDEMITASIYRSTLFEYNDQLLDALTSRIAYNDNVKIPNLEVQQFKSLHYMTSMLTTKTLGMIMLRLSVPSTITLKDSSNNSNGSISGNNNAGNNINQITLVAELPKHWRFTSLSECFVAFNSQYFQDATIIGTLQTVRNRKDDDMHKDIEANMSVIYDTFTFTFSLQSKQLLASDTLYIFCNSVYIENITTQLSELIVTEEENTIITPSQVFKNIQAPQDKTVKIDVIDEITYQTSETVIYLLENPSSTNSLNTVTYLARSTEVSYPLIHAITSPTHTKVIFMSHTFISVGTFTQGKFEVWSQTLQNIIQLRGEVVIGTRKLEQTRLQERNTVDDGSTKYKYPYDKKEGGIKKEENTLYQVSINIEITVPHLWFKIEDIHNNLNSRRMNSLLNETLSQSYDKGEYVYTMEAGLVSSHCFNSIQDEDETDVDCGGLNCRQCLVGHICGEKSDCSSSTCKHGVCVDVSSGFISHIDIFTFYGILFMVISLIFMM